MLKAALPVLFCLFVSSCFTEGPGHPFAVSLSRLEPAFYGDLRYFVGWRATLPARSASLSHLTVTASATNLSHTGV